MERRKYQRIKVSAESTFLMLDKKVIDREFCGVIDNISENGIKIVVNRTEAEHILPLINTNDSIHFQAMDNFNLYGENIDAIVRGDAYVVRREIYDDSIIFGCKINELYTDISDLDYISSRRAAYNHSFS